jgi:hypothetical protein
MSASETVRLLVASVGVMKLTEQTPYVAIAWHEAQASNFTTLAQVAPAVIVAILYILEGTRRNAKTDHDEGMSCLHIACAIFALVSIGADLVGPHDASPVKDPSHAGAKVGLNLAMLVISTRCLATAAWKAFRRWRRVQRRPPKN